MGWFLREGSSSSWKVGWTERTLASLSAPPLPLVAIVGIVVVLLSISSYANYKSQVQQTMIGFKLFLLFLPLLLIFLANSVTKYGSVYIISPRTKREPATASQGGGSPWGVALLLILLVVLISYKSYFHSKWWSPVWGSY
ncbi:Transmembrane protein [Trema orientale]|uniref:Transmembrane protein n=1 Tax=Trema orientale TaxID=63057 RepID=A0A2P5F7W0_TREOI|nr:Transmembrane protein [Trema orientale]